MSTDIYLGDFETNFTWNYGQMWSLATGRNKTADVQGMTGSEAAIVFALAIQSVEQYPKAYIGLEPSNGWGTMPWFLEKLHECLAACDEYPEEVWE